MNESAIHEVMSAARGCAMIMLETANYIQAELPNVQINEALQSQAEEVCNALIGTKHDVISQLFEIDDLLRPTGASSPEIASRLDRIIRRLCEGVSRTHELVMALDSAKKQNPACALAYVLVAESATSIINAFNRTKAAADFLESEKNETRNV
ncbi:MAG TPA: hypothetical protein VEG30_10135 [Terriglobales bacterium]|nr:hypothetical protein [Terriglobales bacterium]